MLQTLYQISHYDQHQQLITKTPLIPSHSFLKQFLDRIYMYNAQLNTTITDITNAARTVQIVNYTSMFVINNPGLDSAFVYNSLSAPAAADYGIVVGTDNTAVSPTNYKLGTIIPHGTSSGQFEYYGCWVSNFTITSGSQQATFDIERICRNGSGGNITVNEIGLYFIAEAQGTSELKSFCIVRDVLGTASGTSATTVNNGEYLKIKYTFKIQV